MNIKTTEKERTYKLFRWKKIHTRRYRNVRKLKLIRISKLKPDRQQTTFIRSNKYDKRSNQNIQKKTDNSFKTKCTIKDYIMLWNIYKILT